MSAIDPYCNIHELPKKNEMVPVQPQPCYATTAWACCGNRTRDGHKPTCPKYRPKEQG